LSEELEILQGAVAAVVYQNYDNGYAVLRLNCGGGNTVTGILLLQRFDNYTRPFTSSMADKEPRCGKKELSFFSGHVIWQAANP
jgi:hypothetical protein